MHNVRCIIPVVAFEVWLHWDIKKIIYLFIFLFIYL